MGVDFVTNATSSFTRGWSQARNDLSQPQLFRLEPQIRERVFCVKPTVQISWTCGDLFPVILEDEVAVIRDGPRRIGIIQDLPLPILNRIRVDGGGCTLATVVALHEISGAVDVTLQ